MIELDYNKAENTLFFHGSDCKFNKADVNHTVGYKDFGKGFYLGPHYGPARDWAIKYGRREKGYIYYYLISREKYNSFNVHRFKNASDKWLDFVIANRDGKTLEEYKDFDIISGDTADDHAQVEIEDYLRTISSPLLTTQAIEELRKALLHKLKIDRLPFQVCVKNNRCLNHFKLVMVVEVDKYGNERIVYKEGKSWKA